MFMTGFILCLKNVFAGPHCFIKMFHLQQSYGFLYSPWCNNSCRTYLELCQGDFYSFDQEKVLFLSSYLLPTHNKNYNHKKNHAYSPYLPDSQYSTYLLMKQSYPYLNIYRLVNAWFHFINISSKVVTINEYLKLLYSL